MTDANKAGFNSLPEIETMLKRNKHFMSYQKANRPELYECILIGAMILKLGYTLKDCDAIRSLLSGAKNL